MEERSLWQFLAGSGVRPRVLGGLEWKLPGVDLTRADRPESWIRVCAQGLVGRAQPLRALFLHVDSSGLSKPHCVHKLLLKSKHLHMKLTKERKNQTELNKLGTGNPTVPLACPSKTGSADGLSLPCISSLARRRHLRTPS